MFVSHAPDNGMFIQTAFTYVGSTNLIEIAYHKPVDNYLDTTNLLTGGGYDSSLGWNLGGNATSWMGIFLFRIENWHPSNYVSYGSPLTKTSYVSDYHSLDPAPAVTVWVCGAGSDVATSNQGLFENIIRTYGQPGASNPRAMGSPTLFL